MPGAKGVEKLLPDLVDGDAVDCRLLAIHLDRHLRIFDVEISRDIAQSFDLRNLVPHLRRDFVQQVCIAGLEGILVLALGNSTRNVDVLNVLEIHRHPGNGVGGRAKALDHRGRAFATLLPGLQRDEHAPDVQGGIGTTRSDGRIHVINSFIGTDDGGHLALQHAHLHERHV